MQFNETQLLAKSVTTIISEVLENRVGTLSVYDVVDDPNHQAFKIGFRAYDYFNIVFNYERDIIGFSIDTGSQSIRLSKQRMCYSDGKLVEYLKEAMTEIELRIPDKFLQAKGWL